MNAFAQASIGTGNRDTAVAAEVSSSHVHSAAEDTDPSLAPAITAFLTQQKVATEEATHIHHYRSPRCLCFCVKYHMPIRVASVGLVLAMMLLHPATAAAWRMKPQRRPGTVAAASSRRVDAPPATHSARCPSSSPTSGPAEERRVRGERSRLDKRWDKMATGWEKNSTAWVEDLHDWYEQAPNNVERYNYYGWDAFAYDQGADNLDIKALIFSHVNERRYSAHRMAAAAGFTDIEFVSTLPYEAVDLEDLKARGVVGPDFMQTYTPVQQQKFAAHALDFRDAVMRAAEQGHDWIALLEDDIILVSPPSVASKRVRDAVAEVPPFSDCIYLEYCNDLCHESRFHRRKEVVSTTAQPYCSAAILYSASGLMKLQQHLVPLVDSIGARRAHCLIGRNAIASHLYWT